MAVCWLWGGAGIVYIAVRALWFSGFSGNSLRTDSPAARLVLYLLADLLLPGGVLVICAYPGHEEGGRERAELESFLTALDNRRWNVLRQHFLNAGPGAPECFIIQKNP